MMLCVLQILTVLVVAVAMALSLAHALELPGKMRLTKEAYYAMQPIYYPGFTIGGFAEPGGAVLTIILLFVTPFGSAAFLVDASGARRTHRHAGGVLDLYPPGK
jgi:hypothetical protein